MSSPAIADRGRMDTGGYRRYTRMSRKDSVVTHVIHGAGVFGLNTLQTQVPSDGTTADERLLLVRRIVASRLFQKSTRQKSFLLYIAECTVENRLEDTTEQAIGHHVFGRTDDYAPAEDNVVRVTARQLRLKLREYFEGEGQSEPVLVEIPKGGYIPVFIP